VKRIAAVALVVAIALAVRPAVGETTTVNGIKFFDTSLGLLTRVTVVFDPIERQTLPEFAPPAPIGPHQHEFTFPATTLFGHDVIFPTVTTSVASGLDLHTYDAPAVTVVFENSDVNHFIFDGTFVMISGQFFTSRMTSEVLGHSHASGVILLDYAIDASTTFEYTPSVPEPTAVALLLMCCIAALGTHRSPRRVPSARC
jgi:hypothetical protein